MYKGYKKKSLDEKRKEVELLISNVQKRIEKIFDTPENMKEYFSFKIKFYSYSHNNIILMQEQSNGTVED